MQPSVTTVEDSTSHLDVGTEHQLCIRADVARRSRFLILISVLYAYTIIRGQRWAFSGPNKGIRLPSKFSAHSARSIDRSLSKRKTSSTLNV